MVGLLFVLFVVVPLVEVYVLVLVAGAIGWLPALALLLAVSFLGVWLVKREGIGVLRRTQDTLARGEMPANEMIDGGLLVVAGVLCVVPGFVTAAMGLLLILPPVRAFVRNRLVHRWTKGQGLGTGRMPFMRARVVDVEYVGDVTPDRQRSGGTDPSGPPIELGPGR
jgi:UPF0716 protein FxsA